MIVDAKDQKKPLSHYIFKAEVAKRFFDTLDKGISLINSYFIISSLSVFSFGLYQLVLSFVSIVRGLGINFFDGLVAIEMRRYLNVKRLDQAIRLFKENAYLKFLLSSVFTVVAFFGSDIVAGWYGRDIGLLIKWASALFLLGSVQSLTSIFLQSVVSFSQQGFNAIREITKLGILIYLVFTGRIGIAEVIAAHVIADTLATILFTGLVVVKKFRQAFALVIPAPEALMLPMVKKEGLRIFTVFGLKEVLQNATPWLVKVLTNTEGVALYALSVNLIGYMQDYMPFTAIKSMLALKADNQQELQFVFARAVKYTFWIGFAFLLAGAVAVPPLVTLLFPAYAPAMPVFYAMLAVLPLYGVVKATHATLAVLREYKVLAMRLVNEVAILFIGSVLLLPVFGVVGIGIVYFLRHLERTWFLYTQLVRRYPDFKIKLWRLFRIDATDRKFFGQIFQQTKSLLGR